MADEMITVTSEVLPAAVIEFVDMGGETLNANDRFLDATIDLGTTEFNSNFGTIVNHFYIKSNNPSGVQISITPHAGEDASGALTGTTGKRVPVTYYLDGNII